MTEKWKEKRKSKRAQAEAEYEEKTKVDPEVQKIMDKFPRSFYTDYDGVTHWVRIIPERSKSFAKKMNLTEVTLTKILNELDRTSSYEVWCGKRMSENKYKLRQVQDLVDYAISARHVLTKLTRDCVKRGIAEFDEDGLFKMKEKEKCD